MIIRVIKEIQLQQALSLGIAGQMRESCESIKRVIITDPSISESYQSFAFLLNHHHLKNEAFGLSLRAMFCQPDNHHLKIDHCLIFDDDKRETPLDILQRYRVILILEPSQWVIWSRLTLILFYQNRLQESYFTSQRALFFGPHDPAILLNHSLILYHLSCWTEAWHYVQIGLVYFPDYLGLLIHATTVSLGQNETRLAKKIGQRAISLAPEDQDSHAKLSDVLLASGDFEEGLKEWRWLRMGLLEGEKAYGISQWEGDEGEGQTLLLHGEAGGFGDSLQMARYIPYALQKGWKVSLDIQKPLFRLFKTISHIDDVFTSEMKLPAFDRQSSLLRMPYIFQTRLETIPPPAQFLLDDDSCRYWQDRVSEKAGSRLKIGIAWAGNPFLSGPMSMRAMDSRRSIDFSYFRPLFHHEPLCFFNLQNNSQVYQGDHRLIDFMPDIQDFYDTATLISALDAVISVDTAVLHLSASLGKTTFLLDRFDSCPRWLRDREDSPWYPHLKIVRQKELGNWQDVISRLSNLLRDLY
jgi:hypothetical protein